MHETLALRADNALALRADNEENSDLQSMDLSFSMDKAPQGIFPPQ